MEETVTIMYIPESQRVHSVAPPQQWLRYQEWEMPVADNQISGTALLRETQARFERSTGLLVPPEYRIAYTQDEPWPLSAIDPVVLPPLHHNPRDGADMEDAPVVDACDIGQGSACQPCAEHIAAQRAEVRDLLDKLVTTVLERHGNSCLDDGSDFSRVRDDLVAAFMEAVA